MLTYTHTGMHGLSYYTHTHAHTHTHTHAHAHTHTHTHTHSRSLTPLCANIVYTLSLAIIDF